MKVLQINVNYGFGSTGLIVKDIGAQVQKEGFESFVAYRKTNETVENGYKVGSELDWKLHAALARLFGRQGYYSYLSTKKLLKHINKINPDIIHLHNLHSNYVNIDLLLKYIEKKDIPTLITLHDCWFFTGKCFHFADVGCDRYKTGCGNCPKKSAPPKSLFFDFSLSVLKNKIKRLTAIPRLKIIGCSDWVCQRAEESLLKGCDIFRIYNGVDTKIFCPKKAEDLRAKLLVSDELLIMGMANKWFLKENIGLIKEIEKLTDAKLMLVGCTEKQLDYLKKHNPHVIGVGFVKDREKLAEYYSAADVFVNLTYADTLPTVNMESICCGTPVITYDSCGSPELIDDNSGIVVEKGNQKGIIKAIKEIRTRDFSNCAKVGKEKFNKNSCYEKYIAQYKELVNS